MDSEELVKVQVKVEFLEKSLGEIDALVRQLFDRMEHIDRELAELRDTVGAAPDEDEPSG